jgi:hydrogenase maturation protease
MTRVLVAGFGNPLMGDDGVGPAVIAELRRRAPASQHRFVDGGSDVLTLPSLWHGERAIWLVDAVQGAGPPATIRRLDQRSLLELDQRTSSCHHLSLPECLRWIRHTWRELAAVELRFWGVEAIRVEPSEALSPAVAEAGRKAADEMLAELSKPPYRCD